MHGQLVHEGGRGVVEQVRVVDQQQPYSGKELDRSVQGDRLGQQVGERGERDVPGLRCAGRPGAVAAPHGLGDQPGLAAADRAGHHDAVVARGEGPADQLQLVLASGEPPGQLKGLRIRFECRHGSMSASTHT